MIKKKLIVSIPDDVYERIHPEIIKKEFNQRFNKSKSPKITYKYLKDELNNIIEVVYIQVLLLDISYCFSSPLIGGIPNIRYSNDYFKYDLYELETGKYLGYESRNITDNIIYWK